MTKIQPDISKTDLNLIILGPSSTLLADDSMGHIILGVLAGQVTLTFSFIILTLSQTKSIDSEHHSRQVYYTCQDFTNSLVFWLNTSPSVPSEELDSFSCFIGQELFAQAVS